MMECASSLYEDIQSGRWIVQTSHDAELWEVIVEPDSADRLLIVITAYPVE